MERLTAFGLTIHSEIPIPEFEATAAAAPDLVVRRAPLPPRPVARCEGGFLAAVSPESAYFSWDEIGAFLVERGEVITVDPAPDADDRLLRVPILGVAIAAALSQRGYTVLHASAAQTARGVVGFLGDKGMGKSTTAGAFYRRGLPVVTDDVLALRFDPELQSFEALPAFPQLKLWPRAAAQIADDAHRLQPLHHRTPKQLFSPAEAFPTGPAPLAALYVLGWGEATAVEPIPESEGFLHLVGHTFTHRYAARQPEVMPGLFRECQTLAGSVPVRRLVRSPDLGALDAVVEAVTSDVGASVFLDRARLSAA